MNVYRMTIFAALLAGGIATGAIAQSSAPATPPKPPAATPAPPATGSVGMDKGAGTGAAASPAKGSDKSALSRSERRFIEKGQQGGMEEVEMSKLATERAQNARVKELAKRLVDDHSKANAELSKLASAKGVTPPAAIDAGHQRKMERMAKKTGAEFDREYMSDMIDHHQKDVGDHRSMAKSAKDADVRKYAATMLPTLEQHLQMVKAADAALKNASKKATKSAATTK